MTIFNNEIENHIKKIVKEEVETRYLIILENISFLRSYIDKLEERIKCLEVQVEEKKPKFIDEKMIDDYLDEGYDRMRDDEIEEDNEKDTQLNNYGGKYGKS